MRIGPARNLPIFWQTLLLLLASLIASQGVSLALIFSLPPPRPDFNRLAEVAETLAGQRHERRLRERDLLLTIEPAAPFAGAGMRDDPEFTARLAERLGVAPGSVRFYFEPDQRGGIGAFGRRRGREGRRGDNSLVPLRRGEPIFFNAVTAAVRTPQGWRVARTAPAPLLGPWQRRLLLWFAVSALVMLPLAWFFARRLTRPIQAFATAADRMGADPNAPAIPEDGPAELQVTAHALNRMQRRIADYVAERTGMIGAIAHDLRTPLARIAFRIEGAPDEVRDKVQADIEQMRAMIAATIGFVKGTSEATERVPVDLGGLLAALVAAERETGRPVTLESAVPARIAGDRVALARLVQNLVDNAIAYGGRADVALRTEGPVAVLTVRDGGPGLAEALIEKVFEPFQRGDPSRNRATGGIGLGLTIARSIARDHGAELTLRNREEGGLEAACRFPILEG